jgi:hypothetical protein
MANVDVADGADLRLARDWRLLPKWTIFRLTK